MARTASKPVESGFKAPAFKLPDPLSGNEKTLDDVKGEKGTVVMFICNHCPYVKHIQEALVRVANDYMPKGIGFVAINSNDVENYPDDSPERMKEVAKSLGYPFPYLFDETQEVAKAYDAACTPDISVFDGNLDLVYRGQLDDARPKNDEPVNGKDLRAALDALVEGREVPKEQKPSIGCNIKWKPAN